MVVSPQSRFGIVMYESKMSSWLPLRRKGYLRLPNPVASPSSRKHHKLVFGLGIVAVTTLLIVWNVLRSGFRRPDSEKQWMLHKTSGEEMGHMWGLSEEMGWRSNVSRLADLGQAAEDSYKLSVGAGRAGTALYFSRLHDFITDLPSSLHQPFFRSLYDHLPPSQPDILPPDSPYSRHSVPASPAMITYKTIHQTDRTIESAGRYTQAWRDMNKVDGWIVNLMDDQMASEWVQKLFGGSDVAWAWRYMHRGVLRADLLRYLLPLVVGGVYSDVDVSEIDHMSANCQTSPLRPIEQWGQFGVEMLNLSSTDGPDWMASLATQPSVIVAVDVDVHAIKWQGEWPRPLGICQWTLSSAPNHPIFLDAVRRVVNNTRVVEVWDKERLRNIESLAEEKGSERKVAEWEHLDKSHAMGVLEWTGPGLFSDAVLAFLLARYKVTWHRLRDLDHPLRIGDVLILPITAFSPGGNPDFGAEGPESPQADVLHDFRGSWKVDGDR